MPQRNEAAELARAVMELIDHGHRRISRRIDLTRLRVAGLLAAQGPMRPRDTAAAPDPPPPAPHRARAGRSRGRRTGSGRLTHLPRRRPRRRHRRAGAAVFARVIADWPDEDVAAVARSADIAVLSGAVFHGVLSVFRVLLAVKPPPSRSPQSC